MSARRAASFAASSPWKVTLPTWYCTPSFTTTTRRTPFASPFLPHFRDRDVDVAVVLVKLANAVEVLLQLRLVEPAGFVEERDQRLRLRFHLMAQRAIAEVGVALEDDLAHRALLAFVDRVNSPGRAAAFIRHELQLDVNAGKALALIKIDDVLAAFLELLRIRGDGTLNLIWPRIASP